MTARNWGIVAIIVVILGAVAYMVFWHDTQAPTSETAVYEWRFDEQGEREGIPQTRVTLVANGNARVIGTYQGSCSIMEDDYLQYEKSKVVCWYAGGGHEIGVFEEPGQVVVRVGDVDEGASGIPGFRGNFKLVETIR